VRRPAAVRAVPLTRAVRLLPRRYGRVFTAWGLGGILAPWLAGRLYDATGGYAAALVISSACLAASGVIGGFLPPESDPPARK